MSAQPKIRRKRSRDRKASIVDTMAQAIAATGLEAWKVKLAKKLGCQAFKKGSRVDAEELKRFVADNPDLFEKPPSLTKEEADIKLKEVKIARETLALERDRGQLLRRIEVFETLKSIAQHQRVVLQKSLETELPPKLLGLPVIEMTELMKPVVDEVCRIFHDRTTQWD